MTIIKKREMRVAALGFSPDPISQLANVILTIRGLAPNCKWRVGKSILDLSDTGTTYDDLYKELQIRSLSLGSPSDKLLSFSAAPLPEECDLIAQFELYSERSVSTIKLRICSVGNLVDQVSKCVLIMKNLIDIWKPQSAYVTCFEELRSNCSQLTKTFPSGYAIFREGIYTSINHSNAFESIPYHQGTIFRVKAEVLEAPTIPCSTLESLVELAGGPDEAYSVLP